MGREENYPSEVCIKPTAGVGRRNHRQAVEDGGGDQIVECSGQSCKSCTAAVIADCVAVCCCPCAVFNFFTLTFLKVPWMLGRKCLGLSKSKKKKLKNEKKKMKDRCGNSGKDWGEERKSRSVRAIEEEEEEEEKYSARFEAEKVWSELYRVDHLGFGRVSFTGIHSLGQS